MNLIDVLKEKKISKLQLALNTHIAPSDLYCAINGTKPFYPKWRKKVAEFVNVSEQELFSEV